MKDPSRTRQSSLTLAAFRPWGSWVMCRRARGCLHHTEPPGIAQLGQGPTSYEVGPNTSELTGRGAKLAGLFWLPSFIPS